MSTALVATRRPAPRPDGRTHLAVDADRACAVLAGFGDVGAVLPALAAALRWTHARTRSALLTAKSAGRVEQHGLAWRTTEGACG